MDYNGILVIDKAEGIGSTDNVRIVKKKLQQSSVGHSGTLDFLATGVLVICLGKATKLIEYMQLEEKVYDARLVLGLETDTYDIDGKVLKKEKTNINEDMFKRVCREFIGEIDQVPPMYSALKVNGKRLYNLAREGITIERNPRKVSIKNIDVVDFDRESQSAEILATVGSGTYIRSLIYDLGKNLGTFATMKSLRRIKCSGYNISESIKIDWDTNSEYIKENIIPIESVSLNMNSIQVDSIQKFRLLNGMTIILENEISIGLYKVSYENKLIGIGRVTKSEKGSLLKLTKHLTII